MIIRFHDYCLWLRHSCEYSAISTTETIQFAGPIDAEYFTRMIAVVQTVEDSVAQSFAFVDMAKLLFTNVCYNLFM